MFEMLCYKVKHRFDRKERRQFANRVREIMRSTLFSFSWVELNNADLDIADQNGVVRGVRSLRRVRFIHLAISLPIERAPPLSNSLHAVHYLAPLCTCILHLVFCNIVFFCQIIYSVYVVFVGEMKKC